MREDLLALLEETTGIRWPSEKYQKDPCAFAEEILGVRVWEKQREILEAVRDHKRVSVRSGHKVSKSHTAGIIALWFFCSHEDARVVFTSVTARQVDAILWRELSKMRANAGTCLACRKKAADERRPPPRPCEHSSTIDGRLATLARSGFRASDFREVVGFTAREAEAVAGISGANLLYIPDEASGIPDEIFSAIEGNRAGGARLVMFSNPTRTEGEFYRSHTEKAERIDPSTGETVGFYRTIHVSSEETPNVVEGRIVIPGLATREWVEEKKLEWGEDHPLYKVRVKGEFVLNEEGKVLSVHDVTMAQQRWFDDAAAPFVGRLYIGIDPAGPGGAGDESAFAIRRGKKVRNIVVKRGLTEEAHVEVLAAILEVERNPRELPPVVVIDGEGPIGANLYGLLMAYLTAHPGAYVLERVRSSERAMRNPKEYERVRDELWGNLRDWIRKDEGAIPDDARLQRELVAPDFLQQVTGRLKVTPKVDLRKVLDGRSPDRADAVCLAVWEPTSLREQEAPEEAPPAARAAAATVAGAELWDADEGGRGADLYDAADAIDPYRIDGDDR